MSSTPARVYCAAMLSIAGHLLLNRFDRQRPSGSCLIPEHRFLWHPAWPLLQALPSARHGIGREVDLAILAAFALFDPHGLL
jgi:hypothetical protein